VHKFLLTICFKRVQQERFAADFRAGRGYPNQRCPFSAQLEEANKWQTNEGKIKTANRLVASKAAAKVNRANRAAAKVNKRVKMPRVVNRAVTRKLADDKVGDNRVAKVAANQVAARGNSRPKVMWSYFG
jgi:hypothetical protein